MVRLFGRVREYRGGKWYVDCLPHGRVWSQHGAPFESREQAEAVLAAIRVRVAEGTPKGRAVEAWLPSASAAHRVERWLPRWLAVLEERCAAGDRSEGYLREVRRWCGEGPYGYLRERWSLMSIHEIRRAEIEAWSLDLAARGLSAKTRWNVLAALSAFLGWLVEGEVLARAPSIPWPRVQEHAPRLLSPVDQRRILEAIPEARRGIFLALALLGLRPSEAVRLRAADLEDGWLVVRRTKNRRAKRLPVPEALAAWIEAHVPREARLEGRALFVLPRARSRRGGGGWNPTSLRREWARACRVAGVGRVGLYEGTKHSRATELLRLGVSERTLQAILGHEDPRSTRRYARLADEAVVEALKR